MCKERGQMNGRGLFCTTYTAHIGSLGWYRVLEGESGSSCCHILLSAFIKQKQQMLQYSPAPTSSIPHTSPRQRNNLPLKISFPFWLHLYPCVMHQHFSFFTTLNHLFLFGERSQRGSEEQSGSGCTPPTHPQALWSPQRELLVRCVGCSVQRTTARFACV